MELPDLNSAAWYILGGSALFTFGVSRIVRYMTALLDGKSKRLVEGVSRLALILICAGLGVLTGAVVWNPILGGVTGAVGSGASPSLVRYVFLFLDWVTSRFRSKTPPSA